MTEPDPLRAAVEALTEPIIDHIAQKTDAGKWIKAHTVEHAPLLQQLHDAVWPSGGNDGSSKVVSAHERSLLDDTALYEYLQIATQIRSWAIMVGVAPDRESAVISLQRWYVAYEADPNRDGWYIRQLSDWVSRIRYMLDKSHRHFMITGACPVCGATEWGDMFNGGDTRVLKIEYRLGEEDGTPTDHSALCQACKTVWSGGDSVTELAEELEERASMDGHTQTK